MKYWNKARIKKKREKETRAEQRSLEKSLVMYERSRSYTKGDVKKNVGLMLDALGSSARRQMVMRLSREGAMSLSKLARPFRLKLTTALANVQTLERAGIVLTYKQGRVRMCVYNRKAMSELAEFLKTDPMAF